MTTPVLHQSQLMALNDNSIIGGQSQQKYKGVFTKLFKHYERLKRLSLRLQLNRRLNLPPEPEVLRSLLLNRRLSLHQTLVKLQHHAKDRHAQLRDNSVHLEYLDLQLKADQVIAAKVKNGILALVLNNQPRRLL